MANADEYDRLASEIRRAPSISSKGTLDARTLIQYGTLAASSHNTQPWKFSIGADSITIHPDFNRRCPVVDPDDAHLYKSLGCAAENIVLAAGDQGYAANVSVDSKGGGVRIHLTKSDSASPTSLFAAIPSRQCTKTLYDGTKLDADELKALARTGAGNGVRTILLESDQDIDAVAHYVSQGNKAQLSDPGFRRELISWIRYNPSDAIKTRDGLSNLTSGKPSMPKWLARLIPKLCTYRAIKSKKPFE